MNISELVNFLKCINEGCACSSKQTNGIDTNELMNLLKCIKEGCSCSSKQTNGMDTKELINLLKCINEGCSCPPKRSDCVDVKELVNFIKCINGIDVCCCPKPEILTPWQLKDLNDSKLPTHDSNSFNDNDFDKLIGNLKRLDVVKNYGRLDDAKYFLLFYKNDVLYSVFAIGAHREIIAHLEDYTQIIKDKSNKPIKELIIVEIKCWC